VRNFLIRAIFAVLGPLFGLITDRHGLSTAILTAGLMFGTMGVISMGFFLKFRTWET